MTSGLSDLTKLLVYSYIYVYIMHFLRISMIRIFLCSLMIFYAFKVNALQVNGLTYLNTFKPGESGQVCVTLISDKDKPELVDLKLCDYSCNSQGQHFFEELGQQPRSNAKWIKQGSHRETVNPGERRDVYLTINVPKDDSLNGSYWSVLLIEPSDPLQTMVEPEYGFQLQVKVRYAYHLVTNVGKSTPSLKIIKKGIEEMDGKKFFVVDVENTGNMFLNPKMTIKFLNKQGKLEKTLETQTERLYPGSSSRYLADGNNIAAGTYTTFLLLDNGDGRLFGDSFELALP